MKNPFKRNKGLKYPTDSVPREAQAINQEYSKLCGEAGQLQYNVFAQTQALKNINKQILDLAVELNARQALDKQTAETKPAESTQVNQ